MRDIKELRDEIDILDKELVELLEKRLDIVTEVARYKIANNIPVLDSSREEEVLIKNVKRVKNSEYSTVIKEILQALMDFSKDYQKNYIKDSSC